MERKIIKFFDVLVCLHSDSVYHFKLSQCGSEDIFFKYELLVVLTYFVDHFLPFSVWLPLKIFFAFSSVNVVLPIVSGSKKKKP